MLITELDVCRVIRERAWPMTAAQKQRVARGLSMASPVVKTSESKDYAYFQVPSTSRKLTHQVIQSKTSGALACTCEDSQKHTTDLGPSMACKHSVKVASVLDLV